MTIGKDDENRKDEKRWKEGENRKTCIKLKGWLGRKGEKTEENKKEGERNK